MHPSRPLGIRALAGGRPGGRTRLIDAESDVRAALLRDPFSDFGQLLATAARTYNLASYEVAAVAGRIVATPDASASLPDLPPSLHGEWRAAGDRTPVVLIEDRDG